MATLNGGFELPEDKYSDWVVLYDPPDFRSGDLVYGQWKEAHFLLDGDKTGMSAPGSNGTGYLRLDQGLPKMVRRVVEGLEAERTYRVSAFVRQQGVGKVRLAVYGFDQTDPGCAVSKSTLKSGEWERLEIIFTPRMVTTPGVDCWGVISLEHDGMSTTCWDDVMPEPLTK